MSKDKPKKTHCLHGHPTTPENLRWNGRSWSCRPCGNSDSKKNRVKRRKADPLGFALNELRRNAKKRGSEFSITKDDLLPLPSHCPVLGMPLDYSGSGGDDSASIDRSDSQKGYVPGNVVVMSKRANLLKNNATVKELLDVLFYLKSLRQKG